jgi:hypothetical protein
MTGQPHPSYSIVLIMKPRVGETVLMSSPMIFLTIEVLPLLSSPLGDGQLFAATSSKIHAQHQNSHLLVLETRFPEY